MTAPTGAQTDSNGNRRYPVTGISMPSANTVLGVLDKPGLNIWKLKRVAVAIAGSASLQAQCNIGEEYKAARTALDTAPSPEADLGTAVHWWTEVYDRGEDTSDCPEELQPWLDRWVEAREEYGIIPVLIERTVAHMELHYAGTFDRVVGIQFPEVADAIHHDCRKAHVLDVKSGKKVWPDVAMQLAGYANATHLWDPETDTVEPWPVNLCTEVGIVAALHADECQIIPVDLTVAWGAFKGSRQVFTWKEQESTAIKPRLPRYVNVLPW